MKRPSCFTSARRTTVLAGSTLALLALALSVAAQAPQSEPPKDRVPFKATSQGANQLSLVPGNPARFSVQESGTGEAAPLGAFTWAGHVVDYTDLEAGAALGFAEAVGAFTAANGDAIYVKYGYIRRPAPDPNRWEGVWLVTGGKGRFAGATGSGVNRYEIFPATPGTAPVKVTIQWEGTISAPKP